MITAKIPGVLSVLFQVPPDQAHIAKRRKSWEPMTQLVRLQHLHFNCYTILLLRIPGNWVHNPRLQERQSPIIMCKACCVCAQVPCSEEESTNLVRFLWLRRLTVLWGTHTPYLSPDLFSLLCMPYMLEPGLLTVPAWPPSFFFIYVFVCLFFCSVCV